MAEAEATTETQADAVETKPSDTTTDASTQAVNESDKKDKEENGTTESAATTTATTTDEKDNSDEKTTEDATPKYDLPAKMKAIICTGYNEKEPLKAIKLREIAVTKPGEHQVLVKVEAASLNPVDWKMVKGWMAAVMKKSFPFVLGRDCSGIIVACGDKVDTKRLKPGMRVCAHTDGSIKHGVFAEYALFNELTVAEIPNSLSYVEAASFPLVAQTAYQALVDKGQLGFKGATKQKVFIFGGSTSCGIYAIQIAKAFDASDIVVTSSSVELCESLGATKVYNYKNKEQSNYMEDEISKKQEFDIVFDCVGGKDTWDNSQKMLKEKTGRFVTIVGDTKHGEKVTMGGLVGTGLSIANRKFWNAVGYQSYDLILTNARKSLPEIVKLFKDGKLKTVLDKDTPVSMNDWQKAFEKSMGHSVSGKIVFEIDGTKAELTPLDEDELKAQAKQSAAAAKDATAKDATTKDATTKDTTAESEKKEEEKAKDDGVMKSEASGAVSSEEAGAKADDKTEDAGKTDETAKNENDDSQPAAETEAAK